MPPDVRAGYVPLMSAMGRCFHISGSLDSSSNNAYQAADPVTCSCWWWVRCRTAKTRIRVWISRCRSWASRWLTASLGSWHRREPLGLQLHWRGRRPETDHRRLRPSTVHVLGTDTCQCFRPMWRRSAWAGARGDGKLGSAHSTGKRGNIHDANHQRHSGAGVHSEDTGRSWPHPPVPGYGGWSSCSPTDSLSGSTARGRGNTPSHLDGGGDWEATAGLILVETKQTVQRSGSSWITRGGILLHFRSKLGTKYLKSD